MHTHALVGEVALDVVLRSQATQAGDSAVRWNCKAGRCGSCSAEINGRLRLMGMTRLSTLPAGGPVTAAPLRTFPVICDLVTDVPENYRKAQQVPAFAAPSELGLGEYRMTQIDVGRSQEFRTIDERYDPLRMLIPRWRHRPGRHR
ncbi:MAG: 2Fe-2S iron-sulfur cluster-binding protein, partial [Jatrophihabitantaceae bacterium]